MRRSVKTAYVDGGRWPGVTTSEAAENHNLRHRLKLRKLLEQENETLRRAAAYLSEALTPVNTPEAPSA